MSPKNRQAELERARSLIQEGADQLRDGHVVDCETFFAEWDEELDAIETVQRDKAE